MIEVDYYTAAWCSPCKMMSPIIENLRNKGWTINKIDVDKEREKALAAGVMAMPTFIIKKDGKAVRRIQGARQEFALESEFRLASE